MEWKIYDKNNNIVYELKNGKGYVKKYYFNNIVEFEGEYLNGEKNGIGKEYDYGGSLLFEGEYFNGKKLKGKGYRKKENCGTLIFEGDYLYGHKRKGKSYVKGNLEYEGEYLYNRKWKGKGFDENGNIMYELSNGTGKVKLYEITGVLIFEGEYLNGKKNGKGKEYDDGKLRFEGEYLNGEKNGKRKEYDYTGNLIFEGILYI